MTPLARAAALVPQHPVDRLGRPVRDLRISVTDRCNLRCVYCMPREVFGADYPFLPHSEILTFEEIERVARAFVGLGVSKIRLTGGEPLLRRDLDRLVAMLAAIPGVADLTLTTNGLLLPRHAARLRGAGLGRVTVSLDALDDATYSDVTDGEGTVSQVLAGIAAAEDAGFAPIKINTVVQRSRNLDQILPLVDRFRGTGHVLRFIEFMDVGSTNGWRLDEVVPALEVLGLIAEHHPIEPVAPAYRGEVAERWRFLDGSGEIGVIASVTQPFCGDCHRARLTASGEFFTCLFAEHGTDLRSILRGPSGVGGASDDQLREVVERRWRVRDDRYSEVRSSLVALPSHKVEMSHIGG